MQTLCLQPSHPEKDKGGQRKMVDHQTIFQG
jgi:hypothetical protein